ncbi:MAG: DegT/DnrJ/EryC1/StrS family aminotransferase [Pontixanthobacter sp.]
MALSGCNLTGSVVTTPFSFAASAHAIALNGLTPIFADIDADTLCLDPEKAEAALQDDSDAVLATHVFGMPCDVERLAELGERRGVKILYDGAGAFGTSIGGQSIFNWGDASALSFHATKLFHMVEGGGVFMRDAAADAHVAVAKAHGIDGDDVPVIGPNAKMSELHAAFGLAALPDIDGQLQRAKDRFAHYRDRLSSCDLRLIEPAAPCDWNHAYCAALFPDADRATAIKAMLAEHGIEARRYFYPALNTLPVYHAGACPIAESVSRRILCLPFGSDLTDAAIDCVAGLLRAAL